MPAALGTDGIMPMPGGVKPEALDPCDGRVLAFAYGGAMRLSMERFDAEPLFDIGELLGQSWLVLWSVVLIQ